MSEKGRIALIFGAVAVVLGGGLYYFFKIHQPKQQQAAAQTEVVAWEQRWDEARTCLLGKQPVSSRAGESLAVREMQPDPWERKACTKLIGKLSRGVADDTGLMKIEHAWMTIDRAASKVANAFATHVDPFGESVESRGKESPLPAALEELDAAHADLRKASGMEPPAIAQLPPLPAAEVLVLKDGAAPVTSLDSWVLPSAGGLFVHGSTKDGSVQIVHAPGQAPKVLKVPGGALRAVPDLAWGATGLYSEVAIAPIDDRGAFGTTTSLAVPEGARVYGVVGSFTAGLVAYGAGVHLTIARSAGGPFTADKPVEMERSAVAIDPAGRLLVAWNDLAKDDDRAVSAQLRGFLSKGDVAPKIVDLGTGYAGSACLTTTHGWVGDSTQVISFDDTAAVPHVLPQHELLGCTRDTALLHKLASSHFVACKDTCRIVDLTNLKSTHVATVAGDKVQAIRARGKVIGVWRETAAPVFYAADVEITPMMATSDGKVIDILGTTTEGVVIARVPVR